MLIYDIIPPDKIKEFAKEKILGITTYKTKSRKYFAFTWRGILLFFIIFYFVSGITPLALFQKSMQAISKEEITTIFFSDFCSGNWEFPQNAQGYPEIGSAGDIDLFSEENSAIYKIGNLTIVCQNFSTSVIPTTETIGLTPVNGTTGEINTIETITTETTTTETTATQSTTTEETEIETVEASTSTSQVAEKEEEEIISTEATSTTTSTLPETTTEPTSFLKRIKQFLGQKVFAQKNIFSAKIKFSFAIEEIEQPTTTESTTTEINLNETTTTIEEIETTTEATAPETTTTTESPLNLDAKIIIWFSLDGELWEQLGIISDYPLSNALNGGYFTYEAPFLKNWDDVRNLKIKFEGVNNENTNITTYLDAIWVETTYQQSEIKEELKEIAVEVKPLKISDGKEIDFTYTDDNSDENLIIKTDEKNYIGLTKADVYFSITNIGDKPELVNFQAHFPEDRGEVKKIEKWTENIPYEVDVPEYGEMAYFCEEGWQKMTDEEVGEALGQYQCQTAEETRHCDRLSEDGQNCYLDNAQTGSHRETNYRNMWRETGLSNSPLADRRNFLEKILGLGPDKKSIPKNFRVQKSTVPSYAIGAGETQYFKMEINFPPNSTGEFYIEAIGDNKGYGLLDPWWNSSWTYRKQITIDHDRVGIISDMNANANSGQNQIIVKDGSLFSASETVVIKDNNNEETGTISSVSSNTLTMQSNLTNSYTIVANAFVKNTTDSVNLTNFPVLVSTSSDSDLAADAQDDGDDIAFTDNATPQVQLKHEIENFNATTGELQAWVKIPILSASADTVIYMYYGNTSAPSQQDVNNVWDSNYLMVQHLKDLTTSTTFDSTSNGKDGTKTSAGHPAEAAGQVWKGQSFDGADRIGTTINGAWGDFSVELWFKDTSDTRAYERLADKNYTGCFWLGRNGSTANSWGGGVREGTSPYGVFVTLTDNAWHQIATIRSGTTHYIWGDGGAAYSSNTVSNTVCDTTTFAIGAYGNSGSPTQWLSNGLIDEVRVSDIPRGRDWFKTEYNNIAFPSTFYTLGVEETLPPESILKQMHYHWRNDDGSESAASSATNGNEDNPLELAVNTRKRVRIEISNEGLATSTDVQYRLEYGEKITTCGAISTWTDVGAASGDWDMSDSTNLTDGLDTTNIATSTGGVTDENTTFETPNAAVKDTSSQTGNISLTTTEFMEAEYSIIAASSAQGKNYCFRLTNAGVTTYFNYTTYVEASIPKLEQIHYRWRNDDGGEGDPTAWYNSSWSYRKLIYLTGQSGAGTNYQLKILVGESTSTSGTDVNVDGHSSSGTLFDDVRFTDNDGTTSLDYWLESATGTSPNRIGTFWVEVKDNLDTDQIIYIYYGNSSATSTSNGHNTFLFFDDFSDAIWTSNNWTVGLGTWSVESEQYKGIGSPGDAYSMASSTDTSDYVVEAKGKTGTAHTGLAVRSSAGSFYYEGEVHAGLDIEIYKFSGPNTYTQLGLTAGNYTVSTWYNLKYSVSGSSLKWEVVDNNSVNKIVSVTNSSYSTGTASVWTYSDTSYFDDFRVRKYAATEPTINSAAGEQSGVGATWAADEDTILTSLAKATTTRLRIEISNEGGQASSGATYRLEVSEPNPSTCASGTYERVSTDADWEMASSTYFTDGDPTSNISPGLTDENTTFVAGELKDTGDETSAITLTNTNFTEIEYSIRATASSTTGATYCFRLTNAGATTNFTYFETKYGKVTLSAIQPPTVSNVSLNEDSNITLIADSTTTVTATATATDPQGYTDIATTTGKIFRSGVSGAENCTLDNNNCYEDALCATSSCSGNSCIVTCTFEVWFYAEPTDIISPWSSETWVAWIKAIDFSNASSSATNTGETVDVYTLRALEVTEGNIPYGLVDAGTDTGSFNPTTTIVNVGNSAIDLELSGTNLCTNYPTCSGNTIGVSNQEYSTSSFSWGTGTDLLTGTSTVNVDLPKPTSQPSTSTDMIYWGLGVPLNTAVGAYTGENTFTAIGEQ